MNEYEHQVILSKMLNLGDFEFERQKPASWAEIYEAIGKLKERANTPQQTSFNPNGYGGCQPLTQQEPLHHYHNGIKCYNNPCYWQGTEQILTQRNY